METIIVQKLHKYSCNSCHIKTNNKKDFERHLVTAKHLRWSQGVIKKPINKKELTKFRNYEKNHNTLNN